MVSSEELLEKVYREVLAIRERLDSLERRMIPEVEVSARERRLIRRRKVRPSPGERSRLASRGDDPIRFEIRVRWLGLIFYRFLK